MTQGVKDGTAPDQSSETTKSSSTRRRFLQTATAALGAATLGPAAAQAGAEAKGPLNAAHHGSHPSSRTSPASSYIDLLRSPDAVTTYGRFDQTIPVDGVSLSRRGEQWAGKDVVVQSALRPDALVLALEAPSTPIAVVHLRWQTPVAPGLKVLGDAWERSYGELGWRNLIPERVMPWYFATFDGGACHGYGVKTDARSLCFWQLDSEGVSLWLNVANGGDGVELGKRRLTMATVVTRRGERGQDAFESVAALCRAMCARAPRPARPIYGANDWCYAYGKSTAETILRDTDFVASLSPTGGVRPFSVIDGGWSNSTPAWPDMGKLASEIKQRTARPGLWIRPLEALEGTARGLLLPGVRFGERKDRARELAFDPTVPEAREMIGAKMLQAVGWGYEMVKHDFSTYDLLGQWGFEMGPQPTLPGWSLHDRSRTNAEVIADLYEMLREMAGDRMVLDGCNTVGHLGQGVFDLQRIGDDTSGRQWERTRRMGVNTAAFRLPQQGAFFTLDPDLVGITDQVPWELNWQWLELLSRSGMATIVSAGPPSRGPRQQAALREAFQIAAAGGLSARPIDWMETSAPEHWRSAASSSAEADRRYRWSGTEGASPFLAP